jgi:hypothetical protein
MNLTESLSIRTTPASKKQRHAPGYWNDPEIIKLVNKALRTNKEQQAVIHSHLTIATPRVLKTEYVAEYLPVTVSVYNLAFTLDVEKSDGPEPEWLKKINSVK